MKKLLACALLLVSTESSASAVCDAVTASSSIFVDSIETNLDGKFYIPQVKTTDMYTQFIIDAANNFIKSQSDIIDRDEAIAAINIFIHDKCISLTGG